MVVPESSINNIMGGLESTGGVTLHNHRRKLKQRYEGFPKVVTSLYGDDMWSWNDYPRHLRIYFFLGNILHGRRIENTSSLHVISELGHTQLHLKFWYDNKFAHLIIIIKNREVNVNFVTKGDSAGQATFPDWMTLR